MSVSEVEKYTKAWEDPEYSRHSPGLQVVPLFIGLCNPEERETIIDLGCGSGKASFELFFQGLEPTPFDLVSTCLTEQVRERLGDRLIVGSLHDYDFGERRWNWGYCTDMMEHLPPDQVDAVIDNIMAHTDRCFWQIHLRDDAFGAKYGEALHLSVHSYKWWLERLKSKAKVPVARDCIVHGIYVTEHTEGEFVYRELPYV